MHGIKGIKELSFRSFFSDNRGEFYEIWNNESLKKKNFEPKEVSFVRPKKNALRGYHGDKKTKKIIVLVSGIFFISFIDPRKNSITYGKNFSVKINSNKNKKIFFLSEGIGNAYAALSDNCTYIYLQNQIYGKNNQFTISYKDNFYDVKWPKRKYIISKRDQINE
jgi:dTDP-4-dehydrorhamnose 3,5-epimerase